VCRENLWCICSFNACCYDDQSLFHTLYSSTCIPSLWCGLYATSPSRNSLWFSGISQWCCIAKASSLYCRLRRWTTVLVTKNCSITLNERPICVTTATVLETSNPIRDTRSINSINQINQTVFRWPKSGTTDRSTGDSQLMSSKDFLNRCVLRRRRNVANDSADVTSFGRSFNICEPATGKARLGLYQQLIYW